MSPILWFFFTIPFSDGTNARVTATALADDVHPISTNTADAQVQLDLIHDFLEMYQMQMGPHKSIIARNSPPNKL
jgi:hypothetical protein